MHIMVAEHSYYSKTAHFTEIEAMHDIHRTEGLHLSARSLEEFPSTAIWYEAPVQHGALEYSTAMKTRPCGDDINSG